MVVLGGMGSVWGVVLGAVLLQVLQSWFLVDLSGWLHDLGEAVHQTWMQRIDLSQSVELIFGLILVFMMLFRRDGLIPATRQQSALSLEQQHVAVTSGGFGALTGLGAFAPREDVGGEHVGGSHAGLEVPGLEVRVFTVSFRRAGGAERRRSERSCGRRRCGDRTERFRQVDVVQRDYRAAPGG